MTIEPTETQKAVAGKREAQLQEWGAQLDLLKAKADLAKADLKLETVKTLETLQKSQTEAQIKLKELKEAGGIAWQDLSKGLERMYAEGKTACQDALSRFK